MSFLATVVLIGFCVKLWNDLGAVRARVAFLEASRDADRAASVGRTASVGEQVAPPVRPDVRATPFARSPASVVVADDLPDVEDVALDGSPVLGRPLSAGPLSPAERAAPAVAESMASAPESRPRSSGHDGESGYKASIGLEDVFGRLLPIWAGGITLAIAGLFIVKWSIDSGLLAPPVRVLLGVLFGGCLVAAAELSLRRNVSDERIPQALAGAGVASLYGAVLAASLLYGLIGAAPALVLMVVVTVVAMLLSFRFGAPSAMLGLVGGLVAPAVLGGGKPDVALLSLYVGLMSAGLGLVARIQGRAWLGAAAVAGGMLWCTVLLGFPGDPISVLCLGSLIVFLGLALPSVLPAVEEVPLLRIAGAAIACVQVAALVAIGGFGAVQWGMLLVVTIATLVLSEFDYRLRPLAAPLLVLALLLASFWTSATMSGLALVLAVFGIVHACHALRHLSFGDDADMADAARLLLLPASAVAVFALRFVHVGDGFHAALFGSAGILTGLACVVVQRAGFDSAARMAQPLAVASSVWALWFVLPVEVMPLACAVAAAILAWTPRWSYGALTGAAACVLWSAQSLVIWTVGVLASVSGRPFLTGSLPPLQEVVWQMGSAILLGAALVLGHRDRGVMRMTGVALLSLGAVLAHILWRHASGIDTMEAFAAWGMLDRTVSRLCWRLRPSWRGASIAVQRLAWGWRRSRTSAGSRCWCTTRSGLIRLSARHRC